MPHSFATLFRLSFRLHILFDSGNYYLLLFFFLLSFFFQLSLSLSCPKVQDTSGSTMCAVVIDQQGVLTCSNLGDSRALLCRAGKAVPLSRDQKADSPSEIGRIVESGGFVTDGRVMGDIAVSRAFGDIDFKCEEQVTLSCDPEIYTLPLDAERDEFVVVACDGLWDGACCVDCLLLVKSTVLISPLFSTLFLSLFSLSLSLLSFFSLSLFKSHEQRRSCDVL